MGDGLVVDLDDAIGGAAGEFACEFKNTGRVAIDAEFRATSQHAVAFDAVDDLLGDGHVGCEHAGAAVGRAAHYDLAAVKRGFDDCLHVVAAGDGFDRYDARDARLSQQRAGLFDALALGGAHGDEALQLAGWSVERRDVFANPVI